MNPDALFLAALLAAAPPAPRTVLNVGPDGPAFTEALASLASKVNLPTGLSSRELRDQVTAAVRDRSLFSARTTNARYVQRIADVCKRYLDGEVNQAKARELLQEELETLKYDPAKGGFPGDAGIPPAKEGSLRDLGSDARTRLILDTELRKATNDGRKLQSQTAGARYQYPAWELVRIGTRKVERDWPSRWAEVGGQFYSDRMIALKDDAVWAALGDSNTFDDAMDRDTPPFAFGSGMGWRDISRRDAIALGVITQAEADEYVARAGDIPKFTETLEAEAARFSPDILRSLRDSLKAEMAR